MDRHASLLFIRYAYGESEVRFASASGIITDLVDSKLDMYFQHVTDNGSISLALFFVELVKAKLRIFFDGIPRGRFYSKQYIYTSSGYTNDFTFPTIVTCPVTSGRSSA